jgi:hypothetical protein
MARTASSMTRKARLLGPGMGPPRLIGRSGWQVAPILGGVAPDACRPGPIIINCAASLPEKSDL